MVINVSFFFSGEERDRTNLSNLDPEIHCVRSLPEAIVREHAAFHPRCDFIMCRAKCTEIRDAVRVARVRLRPTKALARPDLDVQPVLKEHQLRS